MEKIGALNNITFICRHQVHLSCFLENQRNDGTTQKVDCFLCRLTICKLVSPKEEYNLAKALELKENWCQAYQTLEIQATASFN